MTALEQAIDVIESAIASRCREMKAVLTKDALPGTAEYFEACDRVMWREKEMRTQLTNLRVELAGQITLCDERRASLRSNGVDA